MKQLYGIGCDVLTILAGLCWGYLGFLGLVALSANYSAPWNGYVVMLMPGPIFFGLWWLSWSMKKRQRVVLALGIALLSLTLCLGCMLLIGMAAGQS